LDTPITTIVQAEPGRRKLLLERAEQLRAGLQSLGWNTLRSTTQIVPALIGENAAALRVSDELLARGIYAQGIRHPSVPHGSARMRLTPTCAHSVDDVARVVAAFAEIRP